MAPALAAHWLGDNNRASFAEVPAIAPHYANAIAFHRSANHSHLQDTFTDTVFLNQVPTLSGNDYFSAVRRTLPGLPSLWATAWLRVKESALRLAHFIIVVLHQKV